MFFIVLLGTLVHRLANSCVVRSDDNMTCYVQVPFPLYKHVLQMIPEVEIQRLMLLRPSADSHRHVGSDVEMICYVRVLFPLYEHKSRSRVDL